jgi:hypothetical protein
MLYTQGVHLSCFSVEVPALSAENLCFSQKLKNLRPWPLPLLQRRSILAVSLFSMTKVWQYSRVLFRAFITVVVLTHKVMYLEE